MLSYYDKEIFHNFLETYELKSTNNIDENIPNMNIIFSHESLPEKLINIFFKKSNYYISYILENALVFSLMFKKDNLINKIKTYKYNINDINSLDYSTKYTILTFCIKYILKKKNNDFNNTEIEIIKTRNRELFDYINYNYKIETINEVYRNLIVDIIITTSQDEIKVLEKIITTKELDNYLILLSKGIINNNEDIKLFKYIFIKLLFYDIYSYEKHLINISLNKILNDLNISIPANVFSDNITTEILEYIINSINKNSYVLPRDLLLRHKLLDRFFSAMLTEKTKMIEELSEKDIKNIRKLYPLYKLDKVK